MIQEDARTRRDPLLSSALLVGLFVVVAKLFGFGEKLILGYHEGTSANVDAYFTAFKAAFLFYIVGDDVVAPVLLSTYVRLRERSGEVAAARFLFSVLLRTAIVFVVAVTVMQVIAGAVVDVLAPGFGETSRATTVDLMRWTLPGGALLGLAAVTYVALNARGSFGWPQMTAAANKLVIVIAFATLIPVFGIEGAAIGMLAGAAVQLLLHFGRLRRWVIPNRDEAVNAESTDRPAMLRPMIPLIIGTSVAQTSGFVDNAWASKLAEGSIASIDYARKIVDLPVLLVAQVMGIVAFPHLATLASRNEEREFGRVVRRLLRTTAVMFVPITIMFVVGAPDIVAVIFGRGRFDASAIEVTSTVLRVFSFALLAYASEIIVIRAFFARLEMVTPIVVGLVFALLNIVLTIVLVPRIGIVAVPLALAIQKTLKVVTLVWLHARRHSAAVTSDEPRNVDVLVSFLLFGAVFWLAYRCVPEAESTMTRAVKLATLGSVAFVPYALFVHHRRIVNFRQVKSTVLDLLPSRR